MTILQIRYAYECNSSGSISRAAENLFTTTSNVSKILKSLEDELGYPIFIRSPYGLVPTDNGYRFLRHAENIMNECNKIQTLQDDNKSAHLTICSMLSTYSCIAFSKLAQTHVKDNAHLQLLTAPSGQCITKLQNHLCDVALVGADTLEDINIEHQLRHQNLTVRKVTSLPVLLYLNYNHPILRKYSPSQQREILSAVYHYPYVQSESHMYLTPHPIDSYLDKEKIVKIAEWQWRFRVMSEINGYMSGILTPHIHLDYNNLFSMPIPGAFVSLHLVTRSNEILSPLATEFCNEFIRAVDNDQRLITTLTDIPSDIDKHFL